MSTEQELVVTPCCLTSNVLLLLLQSVLDRERRGDYLGKTVQVRWSAALGIYRWTTVSHQLLSILSRAPALAQTVAVADCRIAFAAAAAANAAYDRQLEADGSS
jgi:hypothetical protein